MADREWKKNLGFLEGLMFDPVMGGILGLSEGIMGLFGVGEKNSQIDDMKSDYEKMKLTEDQMSRRQSNVKQVFGNLSNSMLGASQYLNGDTMRAMQGSKLATESAKAMLDQRMKDEQTNLGITDKINQLEGQKAGYVPAIANMFGQGLQGIFNAEMASQTKDQQEQQNAILKRLMGNDKNAVAEKSSFGGYTGSLLDLSESMANAGMLRQNGLTPYEYKIQEGMKNVSKNKFGDISNLEERTPNYSDYYIETTDNGGRMIDRNTNKELFYDEVFNFNLNEVPVNSQPRIQEDINFGKGTVISDNSNLGTLNKGILNKQNLLNLLPNLKGLISPEDDFQSLLKKYPKQTKSLMQKPMVKNYLRQGGF